MTPKFSAAAMLADLLARTEKLDDIDAGAAIADALQAAYDAGYNAQVDKMHQSIQPPYTPASSKPLGGTL